jgi:hypothetical protein
MDTHKKALLTPKGREAMARSVIEGGLSKAPAAPAPSRFLLELTGASSGDMRLSDHAARSMI